MQIHPHRMIFLPNDRGGVLLGGGLESATIPAWWRKLLYAWSGRRRWLLLHLQHHLGDNATSFTTTGDSPQAIESTIF